MNGFAGLVVIAILALGDGRNALVTVAFLDEQTSDAAATSSIRTMIGRYVKAVNDADENILRDLWQPDSVSYVNPLQRLRSWEELQGFWQAVLKKNFTQRELKPSDVSIQVAGDVAWVVFDWEFSAIQSDGKPFRSRGWETHLYQRSERGWRLRHIHYSAAAPAP